MRLAHDGFDHVVRLANLTRGRPPPNAFDDYMYADDSFSNHDYSQFPHTFFRGTSVMKKLPLPRKNGTDLWGNRETVPSAGLKGFVLRTERNPGRSPIPQIEDLTRRTPDNLTQRDRLAAEMEFMEEMRIFKKRTEVVSHREPVDMGLGGHRVVLFERMDIMGELARLKHVRLPAKAKELYVGKGFRLPNTHALNNPNLINIKARIQPSAMSDPAGQSRDLNSVNQSAPTDVGSLQSRLSIRTDGGNSIPGAQQDTSGPKQEDTQPQPSTNPNTQSAQPNPSPDNSAPPADKLSPHNPLKNPQFRDLVSKEELEELEKAFDKIARDSNGSISYDVIKPVLPALASGKEEEFIKEVFQVATKDTPYGLAEFVALTCTCNTIERLSGPAKEAFQSCPPSDIESMVYKYMDFFVSLDQHQSGKVTRSSFEALLSTAFGDDINQEEVLQVVNPALSLNSDEVTKSEFLALIPYFNTLEKKD